MINIQNLTKAYANKPVLEQVGCQFPRGQLSAIIGPNGAGKSTLLSAASRLLAADSGVVYIDGKKLEDWPTQVLAKHLSVLRQSNPNRVRLTVRELIAFGRFPHSRGHLTAQDQAIDYLALRSIENSFLDSLSGGQRQLAFIGMVIAQDTDYVLLDEPLNNLDIHHARQIMQHLAQLARHFNKAVVIVIHDINFASCYADHIIALKDGCVAAQGSSDSVINPELLSDIYQTPFSIVEVDGVRLCNYY